MRPIEKMYNPLHNNQPRNKTNTATILLLTSSKVSFTTVDKCKGCQLRLYETRERESAE